MGVPCRYPDSAVFYRRLDRVYPKIVRGRGAWLVDDTGKEYLDACGGAYVANLGHGVAEVADALAEQARRVAYLNGTAFTHDAVEELARELADLCPGDLQKCFFLTSGSEAVEAALKLARQYWFETGRPGKHKIVATAPGYHGNTLLALSASARGRYKTYFKEWLLPVPMAPAAYPYRCPCGGKDFACPACSGSAIEEVILREGAGTVAAVLLEPIGGSSTGASVPRHDYLKRVREICDRHQVLLVCDEVLVGCGRTGTWTASERFGALPDVLVLGKGLSGGYAPLSAVVAPKRLTDVLAKGSGGLLHAQTFSHTPVICAAGLAALRYIRKHGLIERSRRMGELLHRKLAALKDLPAVGDVRGAGLLAGVEFVADKATKAPFPRKLGFAEAFVENAMQEGLVLWLNTGHADAFARALAASRGEPVQEGEEAGDLVMIAPPFIISEEEIGEVVSRFGRALEKTVSTVEAKVS